VSRRSKTDKASTTRKFLAMEAQLLITHPHIVEWYRWSHKQLKAEIVQQCFKKDPHANQRGGRGKWVNTMDSPYFEEAKHRCVCVCVRTMGAYMELWHLVEGNFVEGTLEGNFVECYIEL